MYRARITAITRVWTAQSQLHLVPALTLHLQPLLFCKLEVLCIRKVCPVVPRDQAETHAEKSTKSERAAAWRKILILSWSGRNLQGSVWPKSFLTLEASIFPLSLPEGLQRHNSRLVSTLDGQDRQLPVQRLCSWSDPSRDLSGRGPWISFNRPHLLVLGSPLRDRVSVCPFLVQGCDLSYRLPLLLWLINKSQRPRKKQSKPERGRGKDLRLNGSVVFPQLKKRLGRTYFFSFQVPQFSCGFIHQGCQTPPVCQPLVYSILWRVLVFAL